MEESQQKAPAKLGMPRDRVPAVVFGCLLPGELRLVLCPGVGLADGGYHRDVPVHDIPPELRMPNTPLWVEFDWQGNIERVERREEPAAPRDLDEASSIRRPLVPPALAAGALFAVTAYVTHALTSSYAATSLVTLVLVIGYALSRRGRQHVDWTRQFRTSGIRSVGANRRLRR